MNNASIIVKNLCVNQQGNTMLDAVSFQLNYNEHLAIIGSSGSGKTTLAKALTGKIFFQGTIEFGAGNLPSTLLSSIIISKIVQIPMTFIISNAIIVSIAVML